MCHQARANEHMCLAIYLPVPHGHGSAEIQLVQNHRVRLGLTYVIKRRDGGGVTGWSALLVLGMGRRAGDCQAM